MSSEFIKFNAPAKPLGMSIILGPAEIEHFEVVPAAGGSPAQVKSAGKGHYDFDRLVRMMAQAHAADDLVSAAELVGAIEIHHPHQYRQLAHPRNFENRAVGIKAFRRHGFMLETDMPDYSHIEPGENRERLEAMALAKKSPDYIGILRDSIAEREQLAARHTLLMDQSDTPEGKTAFQVSRNGDMSVRHYSDLEMIAIHHGRKQEDREQFEMAINRTPVQASRPRIASVEQLPAPVPGSSKAG